MRTRRPDLEALPYKNPGFIGGTLFPHLKKEGKAGTIYFDDIVADSAAQTDRTLGEAATAVRIDSANDTFSATEKIKRYKIDESEISLRGGLDAAQAKMSRKGKRAVVGAHETASIAATFGDIANIANADILTNFLAALDVAKESVQDYADGRLALFGAQKVISRLKRYSEVVSRMKHTGVMIRDINDVRSISNHQLAACLDLDVILAGPSTPWLGTASVYDGFLGLCILPNEEVEPDEEVQSGRTISYDDDGFFRVETYYSDDLISEVCDVRTWNVLKIFNKECLYILRGIDEANTVTTTTTGA